MLLLICMAPIEQIDSIKEEMMKDSTFVKMFNGCFYDPEHDELHWSSDGQLMKAELDCNGLARNVYVRWEADRSDEWRKLPFAARVSINEGLRVAKAYGIAYEDLGRVALDESGRVFLEG